MPDEQGVLSVAEAARQIAALHAHLHPRAARDDRDAERLTGAATAMEAVISILGRVPEAAAVLGPGEHQAREAEHGVLADVVHLHPTTPSEER